MAEQSYTAVPRTEGDISELNFAVREVFSDPHLPDPLELPPGAARPRFLGQEGKAEAGIRDSYASSSYSTGYRSHVPSEDAGSAYALNAHPYTDDPDASSRLSQYHDGDGVQMRNMGESRDLDGKRAAYVPPTKARRARWALFISGGLILLILAVIIPIYFTVIKPKAQKTTGTSGSDSGSGGNQASSFSLATSGTDGSDVFLSDGTSMKYTNNYGVNLGGWLVTEPFISPALYQKFSSSKPKPIDEWTLMQAMGDKKEELMKEHYETFITEKDFAEIAAAGLNFLRIPIGYWVIEVWDGEPFIPNLSWTYFLKAVGWARKYGLRINLDFHAVPGSQNSWNHSGKLGTINWLLGPMGIANAQRTLDYIRILAEFASQDQYKDIISIFGIINEPRGSPAIGKDALSSFYLAAYDIVRTASGTGEGKGPWVSFHDGFFPRSQWVGFLPNADRIQLDDHPYLAFGDQSNAGPGTYVQTACDSWADAVATSMSEFGVTQVGEWSVGHTDCGLYLNGVDQGIRYEGDYVMDNWSGPKIGDCDKDITNWESWSSSRKTDYQNFAMAQMDAFQNWFFWTWKIGNSTAGRVETPNWSYQLGYEQGWLPKDPRKADGKCSQKKFSGTIAQSGSGKIANNVRAQYPWPPASINSAGDPATLPQYTPTGTPIPSLSGWAPTITGSISGTAVPSPTASINVGSGWKNSDDKTPMMKEKAGCSYLDPWVGPTAAVPDSC
ncbi:exo-beta-1,3-glucanase [Flagelloscypha sp. PMI_526]|nr:exo-beta-1,3-glucanase [Flagelloscypha sp. PMI_526]